MPEFTVALDARHLAGEAKGIGRYLHTLLAGMSTLPAPPEFVLISDRELDVTCPALSLKVVVAAGRAVYAGAPDDEWRDAIGMAAHTGLRRADCLGLKADSFYVARCVLEVSFNGGNRC